MEVLPGAKATVTVLQSVDKNREASHFVAWLSCGWWQSADTEGNTVVGLSCGSWQSADTEDDTVVWLSCGSWQSADTEDDTVVGLSCGWWQSADTEDDTVSQQDHEHSTVVYQVQWKLKGV